MTEDMLYIKDKTGINKLATLFNETRLNTISAVIAKKAHESLNLVLNELIEAIPNKRATLEIPTTISNISPLSTSISLQLEGQSIQVATILVNGVRDFNIRFGSGAACSGWSYLRIPPYDDLIKLWVGILSEDTLLRNKIFKTINMHIDSLPNGDN